MAGDLAGVLAGVLVEGLVEGLVGDLGLGGGVVFFGMQPAWIFARAWQVGIVQPWVLWTLAGWVGGRFAAGGGECRTLTPRRLLAVWRRW